MLCNLQKKTEINDLLRGESVGLLSLSSFQWITVVITGVIRDLNILAPKEEKMPDYLLDITTVIQVIFLLKLLVYLYTHKCKFKNSWAVEYYLPKYDMQFITMFMIWRAIFCSRFLYKQGSAVEWKYVMRQHIFMSSIIFLRRFAFNERIRISSRCPTKI